MVANYTQQQALKLIQTWEKRSVSREETSLSLNTLKVLNSLALTESFNSRTINPFHCEI